MKNRVKISHRQTWFTCLISKGKWVKKKVCLQKSRLDFGGTHTVGRQKVKRLRNNFFVVDPEKIFRDGRRHSGGQGPASWQRFTWHSRLIWMYACVRYWPGHGLLYVCHLLLSLNLSKLLSRSVFAWMRVYRKTVEHSLSWNPTMSLVIVIL